jgi:replicative DNA helicase
LAVSFDQSLGHDYQADALDRFRRMKNKEGKIRFHLDMFNKITHGGYEKKTLNIVLGGVNVGKTLLLCDFAANDWISGKNVLYITMEIAEEKIANRLDANVMNIPLDQFENLTEDSYMARMNKASQRAAGRLKIKEYPTSSAHVGHFRYLLKELKLKDNFVPDVIYIDYINICASSKMKNRDQSYTYVKSICEELRALAVEFNVPIWSATQLTRAGFTDSDPDMDKISESFGIAATADFIACIYENEISAAQNQFFVKQLKSRYGNKSGAGKRFVIGVDKERQKLYDVAESAQSLSDSGSSTPSASADDSDPFANMKPFGNEEAPKYEGISF